MTSAAGTVSVASDVGMIVLYDPTLLEEHLKDPRRWWYSAPFATAERRAGRYALWPIGGEDEATYRVRLGHALDAAVAPWDRGASPAAPLLVQGAEVFLGPAERLPGDGFGKSLLQLPDKGGLLPLAPGRYAVAAHVLDWRAEARFWDDDNAPTPDAPPDFVLVVTPLEALPPAPDDVAPLLELLARHEVKGSERVTRSTRPRNAIVLDDEKAGARRVRREPGPIDRDPSEPRVTPPPRDPEARRSPMLQGKIKADPGKPGQVRVGCQVRHARYGVGTVTFLRDGFPKVKVTFHDGEQKLDRDELTAID